MKKILDDSFQFFQTNRSIVVDVKYSKIKININNPSQKIMYEQTDWLSEKNMINHIKTNKNSIKNKYVWLLKHEQKQMDLINYILDTIVYIGITTQNSRRQFWV